MTITEIASRRGTFCARHHQQDTFHVRILDDTRRLGMTDLLFIQVSNDNCVTGLPRDPCPSPSFDVLCKTVRDLPGMRPDRTRYKTAISARDMMRTGNIAPQYRERPFRTIPRTFLASGFQSADDLHAWSCEYVLFMGGIR